MKRYFLYILTLLTALAGITACKDDDNAPQLPDEAGLYISLTVSGESPVYPNISGGRAISNGEDALGENTVESVDFFLFSGNEMKKHWRQDSPTQESYTSGDTIYYTSNYHTLYNSTEWKSNYAQLASCKLYAIVNLNESIKVDTITTLSSLQSLTVTDNDIYLKATDNSKRFLMDGLYEFPTSTSYEAEKKYQLTIDVRRAAAKIRVNILKDTGWPEGETISLNKVTAGVENYVPTTTVVKEGGLWTPTDALPDVAEDAENKITAYNRYEGSTAPSDNYVGSILFYTFANDWSTDSSRETCLKMNIPYGPDPDNNKFTQETNRYKLVFLPYGKKALERNTFYEVDAKIHHSHTEQVITGSWKVEEWKSDSVNVEAVTSPDYLILSTHYIDLRNESHATLTYYSSKNITVELVGFSSENDLKEPVNTNQTTTILQELQSDGFKGYEGSAYTGSAVTNMPSIPAVHYIDKYLERIDITNDPRAIYQEVEAEGYSSTATAPTTLPGTHDVYVSYPNDKATQGEIDIFSSIPQNVTPRFITLRVNMVTQSEDTLHRYAVIKQYPLVYVEKRQGLCSYAEDSVMSHKNPANFEYYKYECPEKVTDTNNRVSPTVTEEFSIAGTIQTNLNNRLSTSGNFRCKFFMEDHPWQTTEGTRNGVIYQIQYNNNVGSAFNNEGANNNHMYEMVVSSTSTEYKVARPTMVWDQNEKSDKTDETLMVADTTDANNNLVSPRFMLASQLGNNPATKYWIVAKDLCKHYVEVDKDGTVYNDWRLPTIAELKFVKNHQNDEDVYDITMMKVLNFDGETNPRYWTAGENWYVDTTGAGTEVKHKDPATDETAVRIRCVRDVKASEIQ